VLLSGPETQASRPELSVVVLCYRAGNRARQVATGIASALLADGITNYQLVLVGNYTAGTVDPTPEVVRELAAHDPRIVCSAVAKRGMMGWDMRTGLKLAAGDRVAVIDGDGQVLAADLVRAVRALERGGYDLVKAARVHRDDGLTRKSISLVFNALFHLLFPGLPVRDVNAKPKVMTRAAYERLELESDDWFIDAEIMIQARRLGLRIGEVETEFLALRGRRSFINLATLFEFLGNLARFRLRERGRRRRRE
jgi:glycosyltransferase involved in cell wall biosynthesis